MEDLYSNLTAVLLTTVANFFLGFIWYSLLLGSVWAKEMGFDPNGKASREEMAKGLILMILGNFFMAYFACNNAAWSYVPGMDQLSIAASILNAAGFTCQQT